MRYLINSMYVMSADLPTINLIFSVLVFSRCLLLFLLQWRIHEKRMSEGSGQQKGGNLGIAM